MGGLHAGVALPPQGVVLIGEDEYKTWETLPEFAKTELEPRGMQVTVVQEDPRNKNHFPGLVEALTKADLLILSTRRRLLPKDQLDAVRTYLNAGKPLAGIRTACHAFAPLLGAKEGAVQETADVESWPEFDPQVLGGHYVGHYGAGPKVVMSLANGGQRSSVLEGVDVDQLVGNGSLYRVSPLNESCSPLLMGAIAGHPPEPVAWTHIFGPNKSRIFYTSLGHPDDFKEEAFRRLLLNGIYWAIKVRAPAPSPATRPAASLPDLKPSASVPSLNVAADLRIDLLLKEPAVVKPLYINFDERGRMWVVEYRQYPWPAGLKLMSRDAVWRNVYDPPFPPPPPFTGDNARFRGQDRITIHESTRGDGVFDKTTVFLEGLNLATAALKGRGGVFVLNPPYLLFYPCNENADRPDTQTPQVLLSGFGIEDTHAIANDLRWGPDGWIYGAQGSTVSAAVIRHGVDGKPMPGEAPVKIMGQNIWRYHPQTRRFEIFAEGGGNTFGVVFDSKGRLFSGHNGGDTRGFYYIQGGYYLKGFEKHGALSNPYTFGYIGPMASEKLDRFTHTFAIYEADALPGEYIGKMFAIAPHRHYVVCSELLAHGSSFGTHDIAKVVTPGGRPHDDWFTPVDIQIGPDGALYIADWYSIQANHYRSSEGMTNPDLGRIYRLSAQDPKPAPPFNLAEPSSESLIKQYMGHPNPWYRQQVLRLLGDRRERQLIPLLAGMVQNNTGSLALEALWALNLSGGFDDAFALKALDHKDPHVRRWTVRLVGDNNAAATEVAARLASISKTEPDVEVRSQLACTAKRLPTPAALPMVAALLSHVEDADDPHIPRMLWWALEAHASDREAALRFFADRAIWKSPLHPDHHLLPENLMQRWAVSGTQEDLLACGKLLALSPDPATATTLIAAFERAFEGRPIPPLPDGLADVLAKSGGIFGIVLGVRQQDAAATELAAREAAEPSASLTDRIQLIHALGDVQANYVTVVPMLLDLMQTAREDSLRSAALASLQKYDDPAIGAAVVRAYNALPSAVQGSAQSLMASRVEWARPLMEAVDSGAIKSRALQPETVDKLRLSTDPHVAKLVALHFPDTSGTAAELDAKIAGLKSVIGVGGGKPLAGKELFFGKAGCAGCHTVFGKGGHIGPDLTSYDRRNLDGMLLAIVNPSAEIREGFEDYIVTTSDGRTIDGFKVDEDGKVFVLRGTDGQNNVIPLERIKSRRVSPRSLMPQGLLDGLSDQEVRDLFAFLASTTPPM